MPSTTSLPPQLQRRTCSRNRFSSFSYRPLPSSPVLSRLASEVAHSLSSNPVCFRRFSFAPQSHFLSTIVSLSLSLSLRFSPTIFSLPSFVLSPNFSLPLHVSPLHSECFSRVITFFFFFPAIFLLEPCFLLHSLSFFLFLFLSLYNLSRLYFYTYPFSSIDTFSPYCRPRGRCA